MNVWKKKEKRKKKAKVGDNDGQATHGTHKPPGPKKRKSYEYDGNNNGQLRIATPPRVAQEKPPGPKERGGERERLNDGNNNGQATHGARKHAWRMQAAWANNKQILGRKLFSQKKFWKKFGLDIFLSKKN